MGDYGWGDDKIMIVWDSLNDKYDASFITKYFDMRKAGILEYGYKGEKITIEKVEA